MSKEILQKVITYENGRLLCNGEDISIEEAEKIVQTQVRFLEDDFGKFVQSNPNIKKEQIEVFSDIITDVRFHTAEVGAVDIGGLDEYYSAGNDILKAHEICNKALELFIPGRSKKNIEKPKEITVSDLSVEWPLNVNNDPFYEPGIDEVIDKTFEVGLRALIYNEFKNQFYNTELSIKADEISIYGNFETEFRIYIRNKMTNIFFQLNVNNGQFAEDINGKYVASSLKIGSTELQNTPENYLKHGNNNFKVAQTFVNVIVKEIRFLKNTLKQEINYSLQHNISKAEERLIIAKGLKKEYWTFLDNKTKVNLEIIISEAEKAIREQKSIKIREAIINEEQKISVPEKEFTAEEPLNLLNDSESIIEEVKKQIAKSFDFVQEKIRFESKKSGDDLFIEALVSGQKININIFDKKNVSVISTNTLGSGKKDFQQNDIPGVDLAKKIKNSAIMATLPLFNRQIDNLINSFKGNSKKMVLKIIENNLKEASLIITDFSNNIFRKSKIIQENLNIVLDNLPLLNIQINENFFDIIDKILRRFHEEIFENIDLSFDKNINPDEFNYDLNKGVLFIFKNSNDMFGDIIESLNDVKKYVNRTIYGSILLINLCEYKNRISEKSSKDGKIIKELETVIKSQSDFLSEDNVIGGIARRLLSLLDTSISSRDDMFKINIGKVIIEIFKSK